MGKTTSISWTDVTWNIARGCTKIDSDCKYCYMMRDSLNHTRYTANVVEKTKTVFNLPLKYKRRESEAWEGNPLVFTSSLTDFFHSGIDPYREEAWDIIRRCPHLTFQVLTKRPERIAAHLPADWASGYSNVWLGTSIGHQGAAHRLEQLSDLKNYQSRFLTFLSVEPLHGKIDFITAHELAFYALDWLIIGGESGNDNGKWGYRECRLEWIESLVEQCRMASIPVFVKQLGTSLSKQMGLKDRHGTDINEFPDHLQLREFPPPPANLINTSNSHNLINA